MKTAISQAVFETKCRAGCQPAVSQIIILSAREQAGLSGDSSAITLLAITLLAIALPGIEFLLEFVAIDIDSAY